MDDRNNHFEDVIAYATRKQAPIKAEVPDEQDALYEPSENLRGIIQYGGKNSASVDWNKLYEHTHPIDIRSLQKNNKLRRSIRHIYCFDDEEIALNGIVTNSAEGFYISDDNGWLLVWGTTYENITLVISLCKKRVQLLDIRCRRLQHLNISYLENLRHLHVESLSFRKEFLIDIEGLERMTKLETLSLTHACAQDTLNLSEMTNLRELHISQNVVLSHLKGLDKLKKLSLLQIDHSAIGPILDISGIENLAVLDLRQTKKLTALKGLTQAKHLEGLVLHGTTLEGSLDLSALHTLETLGIYESRHLSELRGLSGLATIRSLNLSGLTIGPEVDFTGIRTVRRIDMINNPNVTKIKGLEGLDNLRVLDISKTGIKKIPEGIRGKSLEILGLCDLALDELPEWLPDLGLPINPNHGDGIYLVGTTVKGVDMSIFNQPQDVILKWFEDLKKKSTVPLREAKVVFLGDGEAGKTHTIARLLNDGGAPLAEHFDNTATPGIVIKDKPYTLDGQEVNVHFWDFGGQEILHSMHRMFLTERTLYVVLINARDDTQDDRARYWLHNIRSFAGTAPVLLVLNKIDQNPNASVNETELRELYSGLRRVVRLSAKDFSPEEFNTEFTEVLKQEIQALGTIGTLWPASWAKLKGSLQTMESNFIKGTEYMDMCRDSGVEQNQKELLHWFNDLGVSFFYHGNRRLENYVILRPDWITNGIYTLLFNKSEETVNGVIPKGVIYDMLDPKEGRTYRRVKDTIYDVNEAEYVLEVMRKFNLSYPVSDQAEFIPALCQRDSMQIAKEYAEDKHTLEFRMTYDYLPDNVIHRLMVEMRQDLQLTNVWRTGALFRQPGTGLTAVVKSEGDVLRIFVRGENAMHRPNTYLCVLKENIDRINRDMKLAKPFAEVVYKYGNGSECFDYEDLLNALADGDKTYRSKKLRTKIPIEDILNQTGFGEEQKLRRLLDDIVTGCMQLQGNRTYWGAKEDVCNTELRNSLRNMGYIAYDQTFQGTGGGGRSFGELDLEIRQEANIPWTILEALRIKDGSKTEWNSHLKKLLDNYNPSGLYHLFLLTYVNCGKDDFGDLMQKYSEHVKWYDPDAYQRLSGTFEHVPLKRHGEPSGLRVMRCTYDRSGAPTTVTHIFVRIGE